MAYAPDGGTLEYVITPGKTEVNKNSRRWFDGNFWYLCLRRRFAALRLVAAAPIAASAVTAAVAGPAVAFATARSVVAVRRSGLCRGRFRSRSRSRSRRAFAAAVPVVTTRTVAPSAASAARTGTPSPAAPPRAPGRSGRGSRRERISGLRPRSRAVRPCGCPAR